MPSTTDLFGNHLPTVLYPFRLCTHTRPVITSALFLSTQHQRSPEDPDKRLTCEPSQSDNEDMGDIVKSKMDGNYSERTECPFAVGSPQSLKEFQERAL